MRTSNVHNPKSQSTSKQRSRIPPATDENERIEWESKREWENYVWLCCDDDDEGKLMRENCERNFLERGKSCHATNIRGVMVFNTLFNLISTCIRDRRASWIEWKCFDFIVVVIKWCFVIKQTGTKKIIK